MRFLLTWLVLAGVWFGLSGFTDPIHLTFGAVAVTIVSLLSARHLFGTEGLGTGFGRGFRTLLYLPWLFGQILLANLDVFLRVIGVRPIEPQVIEFHADVQSDYGKVLLANSITLTPGTVTMGVAEDGTFLVHAISADAAEGVLSRAMENRVRKVEGSPVPGKGVPHLPPAAETEADVPPPEAAS